jgi:hypothetical protein
LPRAFRRRAAGAADCRSDAEGAAGAYDWTRLLSRLLGDALGNRGATATPAAGSRCGEVVVSQRGFKTA